MYVGYVHLKPSTNKNLNVLNYNYFAHLTHNSGHTASSPLRTSNLT